VGNGVATLVVANGATSSTSAHAGHLAGETALEADAPEVVLDAKTDHLAA